MVAYLLLVGVGFTIFIVGIAYMLISDLTDTFLSSINSYQGTPLANSLDQSSIETGDLLFTLFKFILVPALIVIIYWAYTMAQKNPLKQW